MEESKFKKLVVAGTVGAVLLAVILLFVMVYQLVSIGLKQKQLDEYNAAIARYEQLIKDGETQELHRLLEKYTSRSK